MKSKKASVGRRNFLKGAAAGAAALVSKPLTTNAQQSEPRAVPTAASKEAESGSVSTVDIQTCDRPGSDFMVDVLKSLGFEYIFSNTGSSFRALHESAVNYGGNQAPEYITCCHEESAVGMAHGYSKIE